MKLLLCGLLVVLCCLAVPLATGAQLTSKEKHIVDTIRNTTYLLDKILENYDKNLRPHMNDGNPTLVYINIYIRSIGPISEMDDSYHLDCYFRQTWRDGRLAFSGHQRTLSLGMSMLDKIWKPDTYFWNGKGSYLHQLTTPNRLVRLSDDGTILYSSRLTIVARCAMKLQKFPLDIQTCKLTIGSFAYRLHEMVFEWKNGAKHSVKLDNNTEMSQFQLMNIEMYDGTNPDTRDANYSALEVHFLFKRHVWYFLINFYVPCTLVVLLSWVALWINREATADRIALGATAFLTMAFLALDSRSDLPKVEYPTALDVYILICFTFLFISILEFATVHAFTKFNTGDPEMRSLERARIRRLILSSLPAAALRHRPSEPLVWQRQSSASVSFGSTTLDSSKTTLASTKIGINGDVNMNNYGAVICGPSQRRRMGLAWLSSGDLNERATAKVVRRAARRAGLHLPTRPLLDELDLNSVSCIDRVARTVFPITFAVVSLVYWYIYLH